MSSQKNLGDDDTDRRSHEKHHKKKPRRTSTDQKDSKLSKASKSKHKATSKARVTSSPHESEIVSQGHLPSVSKLSQSSLDTPPLEPSHPKEPASHLKTASHLSPASKVTKRGSQISDVQKEKSFTSHVSESAALLQRTADDRKVVVQKKAAIEVKYSALTEEPRRLFPDVSYLPQEEAVAAIRAGRRPSTWVPRRDESAYSTQGAVLMSAINRMTDKGKEDELVSHFQERTTTRPLSTDVPETPAAPIASKYEKAKQRKDYNAPGNLWTALSKLHTRYSQRCSSPSVDVTLTTRETFILCTVVVVVAMLPIVIVAMALFKKDASVSSPVDCNVTECSKDITPTSHRSE